jgi:hypothetical protein
MQSARIHDLNVMLMVNSLKCRDLLPRTFSAYGRLQDNRWQEFGFHADEVRATLLDRYGPRGGEAAFDDYETRIGNYHSGAVASPGLCRDIEAFIRLAERANHGELEALSKLVTNRSIDRCRAPLLEPAVEARRERAAEPAQIAVASAPQLREAPAEEPVMVDGIPTYNTPGTGPDTQPEPLEVVELPSQDDIAQAETAQAVSQEERLAQAIDALDAAASALRAMQTGAAAQ